MKAPLTARLRARASTLSPGTKRAVRNLLEREPATSITRLLRPARWGNLRGLHANRPGVLVRGTPIDRYLTERFVRSCADDIRGRVLELDTAPLAEFRGTPRSVDRVSDDPDSDTVTILGDLSDRGALPRAAFDCVLASPEWASVSDSSTALANLWGSVADGGTLLVAVPAVPGLESAPQRRWFSPSSFRALLHDQCETAEIRMTGFGNAATSIASLLGFAAEDLRRADRCSDDPAQPSLLGARVQRVR